MPEWEVHVYDSNGDLDMILEHMSGADLIRELTLLFQQDETDTVRLDIRSMDHYKE